MPKRRAGRPSKRSAAAKRSRGSWSTHKPSLTAGQVIGELRVLKADTGKRKSGKRVALVEDIVTRERKEVIASDVVAGKTVSAGRIKKERFKKHTELGKMARYQDINEIDPQVLSDARRMFHNDVNTDGKLYGETKKRKPVTAPAAPPKPVSRWLDADDYMTAAYLYRDEHNGALPPEDFDLASWYYDRRRKHTNSSRQH
jgi:hypothetical protein